MIPDVVGLELEEAIRIIKKSQEALSVIETFSPKAKTKSGEARVINQKVSDNKIELIISYF